MAGEVDERTVALLRQSFEWARSGDIAPLAALLDKGAPPNLTNEKGDTLLILAAYHQHVDTVRLLLQRGADMDRSNDNGQTALGAAVFRSATEIVTLLLTAGADPDAGYRSARDIAEFFGLTQMQAILPVPRSDEV